MYAGRRSLDYYLTVPLSKLRSHHIVENNFLLGVVAILGLIGVINVHRGISFNGWIPTKLLKYLPVENGGQVIFPYSYLTGLCVRAFLRTKWNSFDQRSFFPHTDRFKLRIAVVEGNLELIKAILDRGKISVDVGVLDRTETSALGLAAMLGRTQVLEYLRDRGANLDIQDSNGNTPLMLAVMYQQDRALQLLVESGADLHLKDKYGYTAVDKATNRGYAQVESYLRSQKQRPKTIHVNPVTPTFEKFAYLRKPNSASFVKKYDPGALMISQEYPYYKDTQGLLVCMFGNYSDLDVSAHTLKWTHPNPMDDKASTDQEFFAFGRIMQDAIDKQEELKKPTKNTS